MRHPFILIPAHLALTFLITCKNTEATKATETNPVLKTLTTACYLAVLSKESIWMKRTIKEYQANGDLNYNFYEKDKTKGKLTGSFYGDTLFATYSFRSEGMESVRELVFLKKGNDRVEGYGEMDMETDTKFKNRNSLDFSGKTILKPVPCN